MTKNEKAVLIQGFKNLSQDIADIIAVLEGADTKKQDTGPAQERSQGPTSEHAPEHAPEHTQDREAVQEHAPNPAKEHTQEPAQGQEATLEHSQGSAQEQEAAQEQEPAQGQNSTPEQKKVYTYEEVRAILAEKARTGFRAEVKAILTSHGVQQLSNVRDPDVYTAIVAEAATIGGPTVEVAATRATVEPTTEAMTVKPATGATTGAATGATKNV